MTSVLQSPSPACNGKSIKLIQCNGNSLSTPTMKVKLDQLLDLADKHGVQIITLKETKLKEHFFLKVHNYSVYRIDSGNGGDLTLLIRN
ncbi:hypothetical protein TNCT_546801 [Trichonephila clavata]|uniref:Uncharacterized protein n=1 Tax=Trichonephila clavata TaxID=2740835 RepID=A0A8X6LK46_TRICU|nr:hypothetical protein TNCT_546801 [Trichonephila clavata]